MDNTDRISGILLHVTSLPSRGGVGDMGPAAYEFIDFLQRAKQRLWQVLPLGPVGYGNSPYAALSAFAGNPLLISLEKLAEAGWLSWERLEGLPTAHGNVNFEEAAAQKIPRLVEAAHRFLDGEKGSAWSSFETFCQQQKSWLNDWAMYLVLRRKFDYACWCDWPKEYAFRDKSALAQLQQESGRDLAIEQVIQFFFSEQWCALRDYCKERDIKVMGDVAIFVNYDSADVWTHPGEFELDELGKPSFVSGVPPDYFSETGQKWGNPLYRWDEMQRNGFQWWAARTRRAMQLYDLIRLDHFRGFEAFWQVPAEDETAANGKWIKAPGEALFTSLTQQIGDLPFIAEDLGVITPPVDALRERFNFPGMKVLQFGFGDRGAHGHLPHKYVKHSVVYTGTHDNNTTLGWWIENTQEGDRNNLQTYLGKINHPAQINWAMIRATEASVADICIVPLQDLLHLDSSARMNTPALPDGNWSWRYQPGMLHQDFAIQMADLMEVTDRDGYVPPPDIVEDPIEAAEQGTED